MKSIRIGSDWVLLRWTHGKRYDTGQELKMKVKDEERNSGPPLGDGKLSTDMV